MKAINTYIMHKHNKSDNILNDNIFELYTCLEDGFLLVLTLIPALDPSGGESFISYPLGYGFLLVGSCFYLRFS